MCGRFTQNYTWREVFDFLNVFGAPTNLQPHYNIAPTTQANVVRSVANGRELASMRWQLIPGWWKQPLNKVPATFNAKVETVATSPVFRDAYKRRRCVIPASGYYEWTGPKQAKQPHLFTAVDGSPILALAGLWDRWRNPETQDDVLSCTIITGPANEWTSTYHTRMPAILAPDRIEPWLDGSLDAEVLFPITNEALRAWPVSTRLNRTGVGDDDPSMILPISAIG
jgi:putative SOS response-associated peptidase YedK